MRKLRIFISSPGDVEEERAKARQVIDQLQMIYRDRAELIPVLWEDLPLGVDASFQSGIDVILSETHQVDIAVFIIWSRLGSPLAKDIRKADGSPYNSGTEREFDMMLAAREQSAGTSPHIIAYVRRDDESFSEQLDARHDDETLEALIGQRRLARDFITQRFRDDEGRNLRAYHSYPKPIRFGNLLRTHLKALLDDLLVENPAPNWQGAPYRGLEVFDVDHSTIFYGRDEEVNEVEERLRERHDDPEDGHCCVVIVGASGSGKSSLARAGVASSMTRFSLDEAIKEWRYMAMFPSMANGDLVGALVRRITEVLPSIIGDGVGEAELIEEFRSNPSGAIRLSLIPAFKRAADTANGEVRLLILLDQMEELWTDNHITPEEREYFLSLLTTLSGCGKIAVLATLRSDFYPQAQSSTAFLEMKGSRGHVDLAAPGAASLARLIAEPARLAGWQFERDANSGRGLEQQILEDAASDPAALPLLEYALAELYDRRDVEARMFRFEDYHAMGGLEGALGQRVEEVFAKLAPAAQGALEDVLPMLVSVDTAGEHGAVRRRTPIANLTEHSDRRTLTEAMIEARFLTTDEEDGKAVASFAHEALLRRWPRLVNWVNANRNRLRVRATVEQGLRRWEEGDGDPSLLLAAGLPLEEGRELLEEAPGLVDESTTDYIRASILAQSARENAKRRRRQLVIVSSLVLAIIATVGGLAALSQKREAMHQKSVAIKEKDRAALAETDARESLAKAHTEYGRDALLKGRNVEAAIYLALAFGTNQNDPAINSMLAQAEQRLVNKTRELGAHTGAVTQLRFTPGGEKIFSASVDGTLKVWDLEAERLEHSFDDHSDAITAIAFDPAPDSTRIATASRDWSARVYDWQKRQLIATLDGHVDMVTAVDFSPDGKVVTASADRRAIIWDAQSGEALQQLIGHTAGLTDARFLASGDVLTTSDDGTARLWSAQDGTQCQVFGGHTGSMTNFDVSPEGDRFVAGGVDGRALVWNLADEEDSKEGTSERPPAAASEKAVGRNSLFAIEGHDGAVSDVHFSADGQRIFTLDQRGNVYCWDASSGAKLRGFQDTGDAEVEVLDLKIGSNGAYLVSGNAAGEVALRHSRSGLPVEVRKAGEQSVTAVAQSPAGGTLVYGDASGNIRLHTIPMREMRHDGSPLEVAIFSPGGETVLSAGYDGQLMLWNSETFEQIQVLDHDAKGAWVSHLEFAEDGRHFLSVGGKHVKVWKYEDGKASHMVTHSVEDPLWVGAAVFGRKPGLIYLATREDPNLDSREKEDARNGWLCWNFESEEVISKSADDGYCKEIREIHLDESGSIMVALGSSDQVYTCATYSGERRTWYGNVSAFTFLHDGRRAVRADSSGSFDFIDPLGSWLKPRILAHTSRINDFAVSHDDRTLATVAEDGSCRIWDLETWEPKFELSEDGNALVACQFDPSGEQLITAGEDGVLALWDVQSGRRSGILPQHSDMIRSLELDAEGRRVLTASWDGTARIWEPGLAATESSPSQVARRIVALIEGEAMASASPEMAARFADLRTLSSGESSTPLPVAPCRELALMWKADAKGDTSSAYRHLSAAFQAAPENRAIRFAVARRMERLRDLIGLEPAHGALAFHIGTSGDRSRFVTASADGTAKVWDGSTGEMVSVLDSGAALWRAELDGHGKRAVTCGIEPVARVWDVESGKKIATLEGHTARVGWVGITGDGTMAVTGSKDKTAAIWDANSGNLLHQLEKHSKYVSYVEISPDSTKVLTGSDDGEVNVWDLASGRCLQSFDGEDVEDTLHHFYPDSSRLLYCGVGEIVTYDIASGERLITIPIEATATASLISATGDFIAVADASGVASIYETGSGKLLWSCVHQSGVAIDNLALAHDEGALMTAGDDYTCRVWDIENGRLLTELSGHSGLTATILLAPLTQPNQVATLARDTILRRWDWSTENQSEPPLRGSGAVDYSLAEGSPDGEMLLMANEEGLVEALSSKSGNQIWANKLEKAYATRIRQDPAGMWAALSLAPQIQRPVASNSKSDEVGPDGDTPTPADSEVDENEMHALLILRSEDGSTHTRYPFEGIIEHHAIVGKNPVVVIASGGTLSARDVVSGDMLWEDESAYKGGVTVIEPVPGGELIYIASSNGQSELRNYQTGELGAELNTPHRGGIVTARFTGDESMLLTGGIDRSIKLWDVRSEKGAALLYGHRGTITSIALSPDRTAAVSVSSDRNARVWDLVEGTSICKIGEPDDWIRSATFAGGGHFIATGLREGQIKVWDASEGTLLHTWKAHSDEVLYLRYSEDDECLISVGRDGRTGCWDMGLFEGTKDDILNKLEEVGLMP